MKGDVEALLVRAGRWTCALPLAEVTETMRELPCLARKGAPSWVRGASVVRGTPTPVVDLAVLLGGSSTEETGRLVTVRSRGTAIALRVDAVFGIRTLHADTITRSSRLLDGVEGTGRELLAMLDGELLAVLELGTLLPSDLETELAPGAQG